MSRGHHHTTACALTWRSSSPDSRAWHRHVCTCTKLADPQAAERAGPRCILTSVVYTYLRRWSSPSSYIGTWWWPARAGPFTEGAETRTNRPPLYGIHTVRPYRGARSGILTQPLARYPPLRTPHPCRAQSAPGYQRRTSTVREASSTPCTSTPRPPCSPRRSVHHCLD